MPLTDSAIKAAKPAAKPYKLSDSQGLYLLINPNGSKLWRLKYRMAGKEKLLSFGTYPTVTLLQARRRRDEAKLLLSEGKDPSVERQAERINKQNESLTFESLAREWHAYRSPRWAKSTADKAAAYMKSDLLPALGKRPVRAISRPELVELIRRIEQRGAHNVARKARQWLSQIFRYGLAKEWWKATRQPILTSSLRTLRLRVTILTSRWQSFLNCYIKLMEHGSIH